MSIFAYIDPGTGSVFIQAIIGVGLAGAVVLRTFIRKSFTKLKFVFKRSSTDEEA